MIISLIGYMGSGKSHIAKVLSKETQLKHIDLDQYISAKNHTTIPEIFQKKGEIFFRKEEKIALNEILESAKSCILSVGGGTPVYYDNIEKLNLYSETVFLRTSVTALAERLLISKSRRPLIEKVASEDLPEFIAKHLFERNQFYAQAKHIVDTDHKTIEQIVSEIATII